MNCHKHHWYFTGYIIFLVCLINSRKDVELLHQAGGISIWAGDDEVVSNMFNMFEVNASLFLKKFYYSHIFMAINEHCNKNGTNVLRILGTITLTALGH